jgi:hypothetical protein
VGAIMSETCDSLNQFFQPVIDQGLTGKHRVKAVGSSDRHRSTTGPALPAP